MRKGFIIRLVIGLLICALIWLLWSIPFNTRKNRVDAAWRAESYLLFRRLLWEEVCKRDSVLTFQYVRPEDRKDIPPVKPMPSFINTTKGESFQLSKVDPRLTDNEKENASFRQALQHYPINVNTLNHKWDKLLKSTGLEGRTQVRYAGYRLNGKQDTIAYSRTDSLVCSAADSLPAIRIGDFYEWVFTPYFIPTDWRRLLSWTDLLWLLLPLLLLSLYLYYYNAVDRQVLTLWVKPQQSKRYRLSDGSLFYTATRLLKNGTKSVKLTPQSAALLTAFLNSPTQSVTVSEIYNLFDWNTSSDPSENLYSAINRLKRQMGKVSTIQMTCNQGTYQLFILHPEER